MSTFAKLIRAVDALEDRAPSYVTLDAVRAAATDDDVDRALEAHVLLVDYRTRVDGSAVTLCRLNRRHPDVVRLAAW
ncbi:MAG: hypothetical protein JO057_13730 [Chloroflexi bacterium]|nr:hypothetical protein [Chloroflexota bacterium]